MSKLLPARYEVEGFKILTIPCLSMISDKCIQNELMWVSLKPLLQNFMSKAVEGVFDVWCFRVRLYRDS